MVSMWQFRKPSDGIEGNSVNGRSPSQVRRPRACRTGVAHGLVFGDGGPDDVTSSLIRFATMYVVNLTNRLNVINFAGLFSGTAFAPPRTFGVRAQVEF